jgi:hypothetical protein
MAEVFVPLNRFQSVVTNMTGEEDEIYATPAGVSSIVLSCQVTNNSLTTQTVTILVTSNREIPTPSFEGVYSGSSFISQSAEGAVSLLDFSSSFINASSLLTANRQFIRKEVAAYTEFQNALSETPFTFISSFFENYTLDNIDAVASDLKNNKTSKTNKAAKAYYDKNGNTLLIDSAEYTASLQSIDYTQVILKQIIANNSITGSQLVSRLYQNSVTQSINFEFSSSIQEVSKSLFVIDNLFGVIKSNIERPTLIAQNPVRLITNATIPSADSLSPVVSGKLVLEEGYGFIVSSSTDCTVILSLLESANE